MRSGYFHCIGGASGDMVLGAVVDAGAPIDKLNETLDSLRVKGLSISCERGQRGGVTGTQVSVDVEGDRPGLRRWRDFEKIVEKSRLTPEVAERSRAVFSRLAQAEAVAHGTPVGESDLHELGQLDTLVDVVAGVAGLDLLGIERLYSSPMPAGSGVIKSAHGLLPVPSPATAALFAMAKVPVVLPPGGATDTGEMVTPTGAAILTTLASFRRPAMKLERVGYGLGSRESKYYPNALALWLGEETGSSYTNDLSMIETNIDDMSAEVLAYAQERLFALGARDVWFTPIQMKKSRPATMMSAIVPIDLESQAVALVMQETSTLGVRVRPLSRYEAERRSVEVDTSLGRVTVKVKRLEGSTVSVSPEYDACRAVALERGMSLQEVFRIVSREAEAELLDS